MMSNDAIDSVLDKWFICTIGNIIKYILKVASRHVNNSGWSATSIVRKRSFSAVVSVDFFSETITVIMFQFVSHCISFHQFLISPTLSQSKFKSSPR